MSISVTFNNANVMFSSSAFFMARRPILDRRQHLVAYELLFRDIDTAQAPDAMQHSGLASVIADVVHDSLDKIMGDVPVYLEVDAAVLMSDILLDIPCGKVMLAVMPQARPAPELIERIASLRQHGFTFALDSDQELMRALLHEASVVKIKVTGKNQNELARLCSEFKAHHKKLLAMEVDTVEQFERCMALGFDCFQGYHFARPHIAGVRKLTPSQLAITELMELVASDADSAEIEHMIKSDVTLGLNLLRLVNTPAISTHRIDSLRQALMVLGRNQLQRWLQVMLYAEAHGDRASLMPLLMLAIMRGRLMELTAQRLMPGNRSIADTAFMVGIMSLMDTLFGMTMPEVLTQIPVIEEVSDALLERKGYFGNLLMLAECVEWGEKGGSRLSQLMQTLRLSHGDLYVLQLHTFTWSDEVARSVR